jgi:hypothetical protein
MDARIPLKEAVIVKTEIQAARSEIRLIAGLVVEVHGVMPQQGT